MCEIAVVKSGYISCYNVVHLLVNSEFVLMTLVNILSITAMDFNLHTAMFPNSFLIIIYLNITVVV